MQLRWELENMLANMPIVNKAFGKSGYSMCEFFEQVELDEEGD